MNLLMLVTEHYISLIIIFIIMFHVFSADKKKHIFTYVLTFLLQYETLCFMFSWKGNVRKSTLILQKALGLKAIPVEMLEMAMKNLKAGKTQLLSTEDKENFAGLCNVQITNCVFFLYAFDQYPLLLIIATPITDLKLYILNAEPPGPKLFAAQSDGNPLQLPSSLAHQRPLMKGPSSEWKIPARINKYVSPEVL